MDNKKKAHGISLNIVKSIFRRIFLGIFFIMSFSSLKYFPGLFITSEVWNVLVLIFLVAVYLPSRFKGRKTNRSLENYGLILLVFAPLASTLTSNLEFGQPFIYGILAQRGMMLIGCMLMFIHFHRKGYFSLDDVEHVLVWLAWINLIFCMIGYLIIDPRQFAGTPFVLGLGGGETRLNFDISFIVFGFFYYAFMAFWKNNIRSAIFSLLFYSYFAFFVVGRTLLICTVISLLFYIWRWCSLKRFIFISSKLIILAVILVSLFYVANQSKFDFLSTKFTSAFLVISTGEEGTDASANSRIIQTAIATPFIIKHWLLGNGMISHQWNGGFKTLFGYFYPSDIGVLGIIYSYGIVGFLLFSYQFRYALKYGNLLPAKQRRWNNLISASKCFILYYAIASVITGQFVVLVEHVLIFIAILYCAVQIEQAEVYARKIEGSR